jgi:hypothetical protein
MRVGDADCEPVKLRMNELPGIREKPGGQVFAVETGPKVVRMWDGPVGAAASNVLAWFTTEKLLYDKAHGVPGISGLDRCRDLATYDLLYVGIATKGDSFDRLMARGHKRRMDILANEPQRWPGARVTDEIFLFLFRVNSLLLQTFQPGHDFTESDFASQPDRKRIVADAEKAFVSMLQLQYNVVRFETYPQGRDGLFGSSLARYGYVIDETLVFNTTHGRIRGAHDLRGVISNDADFISIEGEKVSLYVSGVDFFAGAHQ